MAILQLTNLEKTFGRRVMFDHLSFMLNKGERVGFIGDNGAGKSTLFRMMTGELVPDQGIVAIAQGAKIGMLAQDPVFDLENTVIDEAELAFKEMHDLAHRLRDLEHAMGEHQGDELDKTLEKYQNVQHDFDLAGGYQWQHKLEATLLGVGLTRDRWEQKVDTLSGGQRSRLALAKLLIAKPDILLLDEPTNHLDMTAIKWLEDWLLEFDGAVIIISHDRYLLDRLATRVAWLTRQQISSYPGNFTAFQEQRALAELSQQRAYEEQRADILKQEEYIRRFKAGQRATQAAGRLKRLDRLKTSDQMIAEVAKSSHIKLSIQTDQRAGDQVLQVRELSKAYDGVQLWNQIKFDIRRGERIGIIGPNGAGKTTLIEVLLGRRDADGGELRWGANLNIGYYDQRLGDLNPENTVAEEVAEEHPDATAQEVRDTLGTMLFRGDDVEKPIKLLSGGERARVRLAQLLLDRPNVLILDEPTNHLDIASCEALENTLKSFNGTVMCVSHDRYFLDRVATRLLILDPPGMTDFDGNYTKWTEKTARVAREKSEEEALRAKQMKGKGNSSVAKPQAAQKNVQQAKPKADNPYMRPFGKLTMKDLEKTITETEIALAEVQQRSSGQTAARDPGLPKKLRTDYDNLSKKLKDLEAEYFLRGEN